MIRRVVVYDANNGEKKLPFPPSGYENSLVADAWRGLDKHHFRTGTGGDDLFQCSELSIDVA